MNINRIEADIRLYDGTDTGEIKHYHHKRAHTAKHKRFYHRKSHTQIHKHTQKQKETNTRTV